MNTSGQNFEQVDIGLGSKGHFVKVYLFKTFIIGWNDSQPLYS